MQAYISVLQYSNSMYACMYIQYACIYHKSTVMSVVLTYSRITKIKPINSKHSKEYRQQQSSVVVITIPIKFPSWLSKTTNFERVTLVKYACKYTVYFKV